MDITPLVNHSRQPQKRRVDTENKLLDALEVVIERDGLANLSVNAIIDEAGITKPLLYRYFDNLEGLIRAWGERRRIWPENFTPITHNDDEAQDLYFQSILRVAEHLKNHPVAAELLAVDLQPDNPLTPILNELKFKAMQEIQAQIPRMIHQDALRFNLTFYSAIVYLVLRARHSPNLMGIALNTEEGWNSAMSMIESMMSDISLAQKIKRQTQHTLLETP